MKNGYGLRTSLGGADLEGEVLSTEELFQRHGVIEIQQRAAQGSTFPAAAGQKLEQIAGGQGRPTGGVQVAVVGAEEQARRILGPRTFQGAR